MRRLATILTTLVVLATPCAVQAEPPQQPAPERMTLSWRFWGNLQSEWTIDRSGAVSFTDEQSRRSAFQVPPADFERFRQIFAPYEGIAFSCERTVTDGAYGALVWSVGDADQHIVRFDAGCLTGDADDLFQRIDQAETMMRALKEASQGG